MADLKKQFKAIKKLLGDGYDLQLSDDIELWVPMFSAYNELVLSKDSNSMTGTYLPSEILRPKATLLLKEVIITTVIA